MNRDLVQDNSLGRFLKKKITHVKWYARKYILLTAALFFLLVLFSVKPLSQ